MPLVFFISGASLSYNKKPRPFVKTCINRFKRVVIPYYKYAVTMLIVLALLSLVEYGMQGHVLYQKLILLGHFNILSYGVTDFFKVLTFCDIPQLPFIWHLWFILPYLVISCTFDIQKRILHQVNYWLYVCFCLLLFVASQLLTDSLLVRNVLCYNIFFVGGGIVFIES